jgi:uncharacterized membrane protein YqhA
MFHHLLKVRYLAVVVVILAILHAMTFLFMGARVAITTYWHVFSGHAGGAGDRPGLELLHALDNLLVALVMIILAVGVAKLFLLSDKAGQTVSLPRWLQVETFSDLKYLLWETILLALMVVGLSTMFTGTRQLTWSALVIPAAILLLALSLFLMKRADRYRT